jgi:hypothetical protein
LHLRRVPFWRWVVAVLISYADAVCRRKVLRLYKKTVPITAFTLKMQLADYQYSQRTLYDDTSGYFCLVSFVTGWAIETHDYASAYGINSWHQTAKNGTRRRCIIMRPKSIKRPNHRIYIKNPSA